MGSSADNSSLDAIENGVVTLFSQRIMLLATGWSVLDILLVSAVAFTVKQRVWGVGSTMDSIVQGVVLKLLLDNAVSPASPYCPDRQINCVDRSRSTKGCTCAT